MGKGNLGKHRGSQRKTERFQPTDEQYDALKKRERLLDMKAVQNEPYTSQSSKPARGFNPYEFERRALLLLYERNPAVFKMAKTLSNVIKFYMVRYSPARHASHDKILKRDYFVPESDGGKAYLAVHPEKFLRDFKECYVTPPIRAGVWSRREREEYTMQVRDMIVTGKRGSRREIIGDASTAREIAQGDRREHRRVAKIVKKETATAEKVIPAAPVAEEPTEANERTQRRRRRRQRKSAREFAAGIVWDEDVAGADPQVPTSGPEFRGDVAGDGASLSGSATPTSTATPPTLKKKPTRRGKGFGSKKAAKLAATSDSPPKSCSTTPVTPIPVKVILPPPVDDIYLKYWDSKVHKFDFTAICDFYIHRGLSIAPWITDFERDYPGYCVDRPRTADPPPLSLIAPPPALVPPISPPTVCTHVAAPIKSPISTDHAKRDTTTAPTTPLDSTLIVAAAGGGMKPTIVIPSAGFNALEYPCSRGYVAPPKLIDPDLHPVSVKHGMDFMRLDDPRSRGFTIPSPVTSVQSPASDVAPKPTNWLGSTALAYVNCYRACRTIMRFTASTLHAIFYPPVRPVVDSELAVLDCADAVVAVPQSDGFEGRIVRRGSSLVTEVKLYYRDYTWRDWWFNTRIRCSTWGSDSTATAFGFTCYKWIVLPVWFFDFMKTVSALKPTTSIESYRYKLLNEFAKSEKLDLSFWDVQEYARLAMQNKIFVSINDNVAGASSTLFPHDTLNSLAPTLTTVDHLSSRMYKFLRSRKFMCLMVCLSLLAVTRSARWRMVLSTLSHPLNRHVASLLNLTRDAYLGPLSFIQDRLISQAARHYAMQLLDSSMIRSQWSTVKWIPSLESECLRPPLLSINSNTSALTDIATSFSDYCHSSPLAYLRVPNMERSSD